jgi:zinc protease
MGRCRRRHHSKDAAAKLEKALAGWKGGPVERAKIAFPAPIPEKKVYVISRPGSVQTYLVLANMAFDRLSPDYIEAMVMNRVLGSGSTSRLFRNIREEKGFTYGIKLRVLRQPRHQLFQYLQLRSNRSH